MALRVYDEMIAMVGSVSRLARRVEQFDADLARQMRRASTSVSLNFCEGLYSRKRNREARLFNAIREWIDPFPSPDRAGPRVSRLSSAKAT